MTQAGLAHCYRHPNRETGVRCVRCDRPICPECMRPASVGFQCPDDVRLGQIATRTTAGAPVRRGAALAAAPVTSGIIGLNVLVYLATVLGASGNVNNPTGSRLFRDWQMFPYAVDVDGEYYRMLTSAFLHVSLLHIALNMWALWIIGPHLERLLAPARYLCLYGLSLLGGSVLIYLFDAPLNAVAGASGAIFGLFGAALVLHKQLGIDLAWMGGMVAVNFVFTFALAGISRYGHIGGFLFGVIASFAILGDPRAARRPSPRAQFIGLGVVLVVLVVATLWRTATFPAITA